MFRYINNNWHLIFEEFTYLSADSVATYHSPGAFLRTNKDGNVSYDVAYDIWLSILNAQILW